MREIGGYFELENFENNAYYKDLVALNTARHALIYVLRAKKIKKLYFPYFLCDSVRKILDQEGFSYEQYYIDETMQPLFDKVLNPDEYLYVVNYFGILSEDKILSLKKRHNNIIVDSAQAFFQRPIEGIDTIYSCRKFFGVPDGAYLSTDVYLEEALEVDVSMHRMRHVLGRYEGDAQTYYKDFKDNSFLFREEPLKAMSRLTRNILGAIDYDEVIKSRNTNFDYLKKALESYNMMPVSKPEVAFGYPFYVKNGISFRQKMALKKIYIPTLWPEILINCPENSVEYDLAANILLLPCDQRYNLDDMAYMVQCIKEG